MGDVCCLGTNSTAAFGQQYREKCLTIVRLKRLFLIA